MNLKGAIPDKDKAIVCSCGSVAFALRGDGFCECHKCGKVGRYQWEDYNGNQR